MQQLNEPFSITAATEVIDGITDKSYEEHGGPLAVAQDLYLATLATRDECDLIEEKLDGYALEFQLKPFRYTNPGAVAHCCQGILNR